MRKIQDFKIQKNIIQFPCQYEKNYKSNFIIVKCIFTCNIEKTCSINVLTDILLIPKNIRLDKNKNHRIELRLPKSVLVLFTF